ALTILPRSTTKLSDRWCPSTRQPHLLVFDGVPKIVKKYHSGLRTIAPPFSRSRSRASRLIIVVALDFPEALVPAAIKPRAAFFCASFISISGRPLRDGFLSRSCC